MTKVFKRNMRVPKQRPNGQPGFMEVKRGVTPEAYGFTDDETEAFDGLLCDGEPSRIVIIESVVKSMLKVDPEKTDDTMWTADEKPRVKFIETELGIQITEGERDEALDNLEGGTEE